MASTPAPGDKDEDENNRSTSSSYFQKTVCLRDWWLLKAEKDIEGRRISVAGMTSREQCAVRMFSSAPILKTYDVFTLETVDGVCVLLKGFINKARTEENGFSSEVFKRFVFGFPPDWERYAEGCLIGGSSIEDSANIALACDKLSTDSGNVDDLHEPTPDRNVSTNNSGGHGNNAEMDQGLKNIATSQTQIESSPATLVIAHGDDIHEETPDRNGITSNSAGYGNNDEMDQDLENFSARKTRIESSPATPAVPRVDDFHEATPDGNGSTSNSGGYGNNDKMDQGFEILSASQTRIESSPATKVVSHVDDLRGTTPDRNVSTSNSGGYGNNGKMDKGLENFAAGQTQIEKSPATPVVAFTEVHEVREEVLGSIMKAPNPPSISEAGNGNNATSNSKRPEKVGSKTPRCHEKVVKASHRCLNYKNMDRSPTNTDHENLDGEKMNGARAAIAATSVMKKDKRMDVFSFGNSKSKLKNCKSAVKLVASEKGNLKSVSMNTYQLRSATAYGDGKSGRRSNFTQPEVGVANTVGDEAEKVSGNKAGQDSKPRRSTRKTLKSSIEIGVVSQKYNEQNAADKKESNAKDSGRHKKKTKRALTFDSPVVQEKEVNRPPHSTESLSFKRSRSGRILLPCLEFWRNQRAVYDADHTVTAVLEKLHHEEPSRGTRSEPPRKRRML